MNSLQQLSQAFEQIIDRFELAWVQAPPPVLSEYLPKGLSAHDQHRVLLELVLIDLENRWKNFASQRWTSISEAAPKSEALADLPRCPLLEDYCRAFEELGSVESLPLAAVMHEYRLRRRADGLPSRHEYLQRFPHFSEELSRQLPASDHASEPSDDFAPETLVQRKLNGPAKDASPRSELSPASGTQFEQQAGSKESLTLQTIHPWKQQTGPPSVSKTSLRHSISLRPREVLFSGRGHLETWDYEIGPVLGEGGMGTVFRARQGCIDRDVAVKMTKTRSYSKADRKQAVEKFLSEAVITGALEHPNVVPIYDMGLTSRGEPFYVMKEVRGKAWSRTIDSASEDDNLNTLLRVADAVGFAHTRGVVHRDLKPDNVMLGEFGEVLVLDWGLAMPTPQFASTNIAYAEGLAGTPAYMAPEMAVEFPNQVGPLSDIYLLGALLFRCLVGKPPHPGRTVSECLKSAEQNDIIKTDRNDELMQIARKAMASQLEDRYQSTGEFQQAIKEYRSHTESYRLTDFALQELKTAQGTADYRRFERAVLGLEQAMELWSGNQTAGGSLAPARLAYAHAAFDRHDYELAEQQLDARQPTHAELLPRIQQAKEERDARVVRLRRLKKLAAGLMATVLVTVSVAAVWINHSRTEERLAKIEAVRRFQQSQVAISRITSISDQIRHLPRLQAVRKNLLEMVAGYYQELTDSPSQNPEMQLELARSLLQLGDVHRQLAEHRAAIAAWDQAMQFAKSLRSSDFADQTTVLIQHAQLRSISSLIAQHDFKEAEHRLEALIGELRQTGHSSSRELAQTLFQRGMLAREQGQTDVAIDDLLEAEKIYELLEGKESEHRTDPRGVATTLSTLGQLFQQRGEFHLANEKIRHACGVWSWQVIGNPSDTELREGYATSEIDLANTLRGTGHEESVAILESAIRSYEELVRARPEIPHYEFNLATARMNLASWLGRRGETEAAQGLAVQAINGIIRLANEYPEDLRYPDREAEARLALAEILRDRNEIDLASDMLDEAVKHQKQMLSKNPSPQYHEQAALAASLRAQLHVLKEDAASARESFQAAIAAWDQLIQEVPAQAARYRDSAAWTRFHFATHLVAEGDTAEAKSQIDSAIRLRELLPVNAIWDESFAWLLLLGPANEKRDPQRGLPLAQRAASAAADNPKFWRTLAIGQLRNQQLDECHQSLKQARELGDDPTGETDFLESLLAAKHGDSELARARQKQGNELMRKTVPGSPRLRVLQTEVIAALKADSDK